VPCLEKVASANLTKLARIQTAVRRFARAHGLKRRIIRAPRGRRYSKSGHPFVEEEYGAVYTRPVRTGASRIPPDVAAAIHRRWSDGVVDEFATDESYFHQIRARLERDLRHIRGASLPWRTEDPPLDARPDEDDEPLYPDEWQSYYVFFLAPDGEEFQFEDETDCMEEPEDAEGERTEAMCPGNKWIGCAVGISLVAPYAAINLCSYALRSICVEVVQRNPHGFRGRRLSTVIGRKSYCWLALAQELGAG
jgi:hypothetical protein